MSAFFSLNQTDEMYQLISRFQSMPFIEDFDIFELLNKIEKGYTSFDKRDLNN